MTVCCRFPSPAPSCFNEIGAAHFSAAVSAESLDRFDRELARYPADRPGIRIGHLSAMRDMLSVDGAVGKVAAWAIGADARPVRAVLFDKTAVANWALGWHQDRTIVVERRVDVAGFGPWTVKAGLIQVEPPFSVLRAMVTLRVHLDPVDSDNAPLRIVPGSHRLGRIAQDGIDAVVARLGETACLAGRGDIWLYATPIVHGSRAAVRPRRRRVLQIDYAATDLPAPLRWHSG